MAKWQVTSAHNKIGTTECPTSRYSTESQDSRKWEQVYMSSGSLLVTFREYVVMNAACYMCVDDGSIMRLDLQVFRRGYINHTALVSTFALERYDLPPITTIILVISPSEDRSRNL
jgi:hypothetical protein